MLQGAWKINLNGLRKGQTRFSIFFEKRPPTSFEKILDPPFQKKCQKIPLKVKKNVSEFIGFSHTFYTKKERRKEFIFPIGSYIQWPKMSSNYDLIFLSEDTFIWESTTVKLEKHMNFCTIFKNCCNKYCFGNILIFLVIWSTSVFVMSG